MLFLLYVVEIRNEGAAIKMHSYVQLRFWQIIVVICEPDQIKSSFTFQYKVRKECAADSLRVLILSNYLRSK